ncbi:MAG: hypothetical protein WC369_10000 [Dehalococcoidales bacterium]|jgi:hypothetical protein
MKRDRTAGSGLIKATYFIWSGYSRCVDRFESVFMQSSVMKLLKGSADILSVCLEGSFVARMSRSSNGVYSESALLGNIKRSFCRAESLIGLYYEGSSFRRIAVEIDALLVPVDMFLSGTHWDTLKDSSKIIGILRRCNRKK